MFKTSRGRSVRIEPERRRQAAIDFVRVAVVQEYSQVPSLHAAWNAFRVTAEVTVDAIVGATKGEVKINAFDEAPKKSSCFFF